MDIGHRWLFWIKDSLSLCAKVIMHRFNLESSSPPKIGWNVCFGSMGRPSECGIGFCTRDFNDFEHAHYWNNGQNHSMVLYTNGYNPWSHSMFRVEADARSWHEDNSLIKYLSRSWCSEQGEEVIVKIHTVTMRVLIWNYSRLQIGNLQFDEVDRFSDAAFLFELPMDKEIAMIVEMGHSEQTMTVINQRFRYLSSE